MFSLSGLAARERRVQMSENMYTSAEIDLSANSNASSGMDGLRKLAVDFSQIPLQPASPPISMLRGDTYMTKRETMLTILCHDRLQSKMDIYVEDKSLFCVEGAPWGTSWSWRRKVFDASTGADVFDFRHESLSLKNGWTIEESKKEKLCALVHEKFFTKTHSAIVATLRTQAGEDVTAHMQPSDRCTSLVSFNPYASAISFGGTDRKLVAVASTINVGEHRIACIYKIAMETSLIGYDKDRSLYKVHVAPGVDLRLVSKNITDLSSSGDRVNKVQRLWHWRCVGRKWALFGHSDSGYAELFSVNCFSGPTAIRIRT